MTWDPFFLNKSLVENCIIILNDLTLRYNSDFTQEFQSDGSQDNIVDRLKYLFNIQTNELTRDPTTLIHRFSPNFIVLAHNSKR